MPIPEYECEVFPKRPIKTAICQVRFGEILKISAEDPAAFQDRVSRGGFSQFARTQTVAFAFVAGQAAPAPMPQGGQAFQFSTADGAYVLGLSTGTLSLEARAYSDFETFTSFLRTGLDALTEVYRPPAYSRLGLRYVNEVVRINRTDQRLDWRSWINNDLVPKIACDPLHEDVQGSGHVVTFGHAYGMTNVRYGLQPGELNGYPAESFTLDMDCFYEGALAPIEAIERSAAFNKWLYNFFRWAAGEQLHEAMRGKSDDQDVILGAATAAR